MGFVPTNLDVLGCSPIDTRTLSALLQSYPYQSVAMDLIRGFSYGFRICYDGPRIPFICKNLKSILANHEVAEQKINEEVRLGRVAGPFVNKPFDNLRCSPIGLVPKKSGGFRLIMDLSYPPGFSVNDFIDPELTSVTYAKFDDAIAIVKRLGKGALMGKMDIKSAFRLLPCSPQDFDLLGFTFKNKYYIEKMLPMGLSLSCATFEKFANFLEWELRRRVQTENTSHYLDDFFLAGTADSNDCQNIMSMFGIVCKELGVPLAIDKTEGPSTDLTFLGFTIDSVALVIKIPEDKVKSILSLLSETLQRKKIRLRELQSLAGSLAFCSRALPAARAFLRRFYAAMSAIKKPHHFVRLSSTIKEDLNIWVQFLREYNGSSEMLDVDWVSADDLHLYTDSAGNAALGCGVYFKGEWSYLQWPSSWSHTGLLTDITFLELVPIFLAFYLWRHQFKSLRVRFACDNMSVVHILNTKTSKSERVMQLVRRMVLWSLQGSFHFSAHHVPGRSNIIADSISRFQWQEFRLAAPNASIQPTVVPEEFWTFLPLK